MLVRITPQQAVLGMCVEGVEGGWLSHPFWRERFVIKSAEDLARVRNGGTNLFINPERGASPLVAKANQPSADDRSLIQPMRTRSSPPPTFTPQAKRLPKRIASTPRFDQADRVRATAVAKRSTKIIGDVFDDCRRGHPVVMPQIASVVQDIENTLEQNSSAFATVTRLKEKDGYTYTHSIAVCALMITLARANNASPEEVRYLGIAGMLHDIGKLSIDSAILTKTGPLDEEEKAIVRLHPEMGHKLLAADPQVPPVALDVCLHHHERLDGTGYPFGLEADQLTTAVRIAVICDVYDAMTSNRPYSKGKAPIDAIAEMESLPGLIDQDLLFKFMRGIGVFPVGKLVRLRSNRLGVIMQTTSANSKPAARAFYSIVEGRFVDYADVTLSDSFRDDQVVGADDPVDRFGDEWPMIRERVIRGLSDPRHLSERA